MELFYEKFAYSNNKCWLMRETGRSIYELDLNDGSLNVFISLNEKRYLTDFLSQDMMCINNTLLVIPKQGEFIHTIDLEKKSDKTITIKEFKNQCFKSNVRFLFMTKSNRYIYFIPYAYLALIKYDISDGSITYIDNFVNDIIKLDNLGVGMFYGACIVDNYLYLTLRGANYVLRFNTLNNNYEMYKVGKNENIYMGICYDKKNDVFFLTAMSGQMLKWNGHSEESEEWFDFKYDAQLKNESEEVSPNFSNVFIIDDEVWLFSNCYKTVKINTVTKEYVVAEELGDCNSFDHLCVKKEDSIFISNCRKDKKIMVYDFVDKKMKILSIDLSFKTEEKILNDFIDEIIDN